MLNVKHGIYQTRNNVDTVKIHSRNKQSKRIEENRRTLPRTSKEGDSARNQRERKAEELRESDSN
jgi:hypothetical protein